MAVLMQGENPASSEDGVDVQRSRRMLDARCWNVESLRNADPVVAEGQRNSMDQDAIDHFVTEFGNRQGNIVSAAHPSLRIEDVYEIGNVLGAGASTKITVRLGTHTSTREKVAIKTIPKSALTSATTAQ